MYHSNADTVVKCFEAPMQGPRDGAGPGSRRRAGERREAAAIRQATGAMAYRRVMAAQFAVQGAKAHRRRPQRGGSPGSGSRP